MTHFSHPIPIWLKLLSVFLFIWGIIWYVLHHDGVHDSMNTRHWKELQTFIDDQ